VAIGDEPGLDLVVAGHANIDRFLEVPSLPRSDRTTPLTAQRDVLGGTAATLARVASAAGVRTGLVSRVGRDFPESFVAQLRRERVELSGLERVPDARSPICYIVEDGRGHQMTLIHQGPMGSTEGAHIPEELLAGARWLHLTTGAPSYQLQLKAAARAHGVRIAVDPAQEVHYLWEADPLAELLEGAEVLFGNRAEIERAQKLLRARGPEGLLDRVPLILRTEGKDGVTAFHRGGSVHVAAVPVRHPHLVTGAGDAFRGGFYGAFFSGEPLEKALRAGVAGARGWMRRGDRRPVRAAPGATA
jgi:sugar/nucleoside kinase (ribokinase family)